MAINTQKFLPAPKSSVLAKITPKTVSTQGFSSIFSGKTIKNIGIIKVKVIQIEKILKGTIALKKKSLDDKKRKDSGTRREKQEEKLETKPNVEKGNIKMPSAPRLGILDWVKNFIGNIILGYFAVRLIDHLPKIIPIVKFLGAAADFIIDIGGKLLNGLVTFIDWGYKAYDATRGFIKNLGGENFAKGFDKFTGLIDTALFLTTVLAGSIALESMSGGNGGGGPGGGRQRVGGKGAGRVDPKVARRYAERFGRDAALKKFGKEGLDTLGGKYARSGATNLARKGLVGLAGKGGAKAILGFARPFLKRLPIIGALIDFGLSVALGEDPGRAAFKAIGAGLLGFIGGAIGAVGGPLSIAGAILGSFAGDALGGALYDTFFGGKKPQQKNQKVEKKAGGGITRGGKTQGTVKRTIKKPKRTIRTLPSKVKPGQSIGGEKNIKKIFPEVDSKDKGKKINPYGYMKSSYEKLSSAEAFGGLFALPLKAQFGEEPSKLDYQNAASGLNSWMQRTFSSEIMRTGGVGFAEGGSVNAGMFSNGEDLTKIISKSLEESISSKVTAAINDLKKQLMLKEEEKKGDDKKTGPDGGAMGTGEYSPEGLQGEIYQYLLSKGLDDIHAIGLMANISRESGFRPGVEEEGGGGGVGLFQYTNEPRKGNFLKAVPDYKTNWKGQIDYALKEPGEPAPQWLAMKFSSPQEAADWFMRKWERPAEYIQNTEGPKIHAEYIKSLEKYKSKTGKGYDLPSENLGSKGSAVQYITGDVNYKGDGQQFYYDLKDHGLPGNYHDHIAFKTVADKEIAKKKLRAAGIKIGSEYIGRENDRGYHGKNLAIDVPGYQWGGSGTIGQKEFDGSKKVRQVLGIGAFAKGGRVLKPTLATLAEDGREEFVFDADTTRGLDHMAPRLLEKLNAAKTKPQLMKILQSYMGGDTQIAATYGGATAERQQKIDAFMNQKGMPAGKGFQGRFDMFGREYETNTGKLKQASNKPSPPQIASYASYEQSYPSEVFIPIPIPVPIGSGGGNSSGSSGGTIIAMGGGSNPFDSLYKGG